MPPDDRRRLVAAEIMRAVYFETLMRIERNGYDVFTHAHPRAAAAAGAHRAEAVAVDVSDVIIVGAGVAGLSAAVRLARDGARVLVLEARSRLGGRATAFADRETGELVDNGQHVLLGCYTETFAFLREIGADRHVSLQPNLGVTMIDRAGRRSRLACPALPPPLHLLAGVMDWDALGWADRLSILRMAAPLRIGAAGARSRARAIWRRRPARRSSAG